MPETWMENVLCRFFFVTMEDSKNFVQHSVHCMLRTVYSTLYVLYNELIKDVVFFAEIIKANIYLLYTVN